VTWAVQPGDAAARPTLCFLYPRFFRRICEVPDINLARGVVYVRGTKTEASDDTIAIPPWARPLLEHVLATVGHRQNAMLRPWTSIRKDLAAACRRIGRKRKAAELGVTPHQVARLITKGEAWEEGPLSANQRNTSVTAARPLPAHIAPVAEQNPPKSARFRAQGRNRTAHTRIFNTADPATKQRERGWICEAAPCCVTRA
jgi:hypothetical protein